MTAASLGSGLTHRVALLAVPDGDVSALSSLVQVSPTSWEFTPSASVYGTYRVELIVDENLPTEARTVHTFAIRTPAASLRIPAYNERSDPNASAIDYGGARVAASETNEPTLIYPLGEPFGWWRSLVETMQQVETLAAGGGGKRFATYVVGNQIAGDTLSDCDYLDPGDGSGITAAISAAYSAPGRIIIRRGPYTLPATWTPPTIPAGTCVEGEGASTVIFAPAGDVATLPWQVFVLGGARAELTDMLISIPDRDPLSLAPTSVIPVIAVDALNSAVRRVTIEIPGNLSVADYALSALHFSNPDFTLGGQVFEDVTLDMTFATVTGHATNPYAVAFCSSGDIAAPYAMPALTGNRTQPEFVRCRLVGGKTDEAAVPPYQTFGALHARASEMGFTDCCFEGVLLGYVYLIANPSGTIEARGPSIRGGIVRAAPGVTGLFVQGVLVFANDSGGTLILDRVHIDRMESQGATTGSVNPGIYVSGSSKIRDVLVDRCTIRANSTSTPLGAAIAVIGIAATLEDVRITGNACRGSGGADGSIDVDLCDSPILLGNQVDAVNVNGGTDTNVSINRVRQVAGITDAGTGTSQTGNIVG